MSNLKNTRNTQRRGIALTELAIVMPLLLAITFGVMEYGWMFIKANQVANAARQGARVGARPDSTSATVTNAIATAMTAANIPSAAYTVTMTPNNPAAVLSGQPFKVRIQVTYASVDLGLPLIPVPTNLVSEVTMAKEGP